MGSGEVGCEVGCGLGKNENWLRWRGLMLGVLLFRNTNSRMSRGGSFDVSKGIAKYEGAARDWRLNLGSILRRALREAPCMLVRYVSGIVRTSFKKVRFTISDTLG